MQNSGLPGAEFLLVPRTGEKQMQPSQWPLPPPVMKWVGKSYPTLHKDPGNRPHTTGHRTTHRQTPGPLPTDACITPRSTASPQHCGHHHTCECQRHTQTASQHISTTQTHTHTQSHIAQSKTQTPPLYTPVTQAHPQQSNPDSSCAWMQPCKNHHPPMYRIPQNRHRDALHT